MHKWYADDTALNKKIGDTKRPIYLFGGILISREDEMAISDLMKAIKSEYTGQDMPIKYNMKDLKPKYARFGKESDLKNLIEDSDNWRRTLIQEVINYDFKFFIGCIENFQANVKKQKIIKENLSAFIFSNALMRVGLYVQQNKIGYTQVILDWPEGSKPNPFDKEYYYAYNRGCNSEKQGYYCGPLSEIGFDQTLYYARCNHSNMLQLADIMLGATRHWIETELQKREYSIGSELTKLILPKFYSHQGSILGAGISVSSNNQDLKIEIEEILNRNMA